MKRQKYFMFFLIGSVLSAVAIAYPTKKASAHGGDSQFIAESSLLAGLAPGAAFPFIDTTPHKIAQAHIAITDSSSDCHPGAAPPDNKIGRASCRERVRSTARAGNAKEKREIERRGKSA